MALRYAWLVLLPALPLVAGTIDVSSQTTVFLNTGDLLFYTVPDGNFVKDAQSLGVSPYPTAVTFQLLTAPLTGPTSFTVDLQSSDGSAAVGLSGPVSFAPGTLAGSLYTGPVSALAGTLHLSASLSAQVFAGSSAILAVRNDGAPISLGLDPYTNRQDLYVTLAGPNFSVGALQGTVLLDPPSPDPTPEPASALLLAAGIATLGAIRKPAR